MLGGGQPPPPHGQDVEGLGGRTVPGSELHQLGGATTEAQGEREQSGVLLRELRRQPEEKRVGQGVCRGGGQQY